MLRRVVQVGRFHSLAAGILSRGFKTTSTTHPVPVFDDDERIFKKVMKERAEDLPSTVANPYEKPKKKCILCEHNVYVDYKNVKLLYQFVSPFTGMIYGRHITGLCKAQHMHIKSEIGKARAFGWMASYLKEVEFLKDPKLCDPERPFRPHPY